MGDNHYSRQRRRRSRLPSRNDEIDLSSMFMPKPMEIVVTPEMAFHCFDILISKLKETLPTIIVDIPSVSYPLFLTWERRRGQEDQLLTCLGSFEPVPLLQGLTDFSVASAERENGYSNEEIADLRVTVSILWKFEERKNFLDWTVGVHGLQLALPGKRVANWLPEYPLEMGWTKVETIDALMLKAGFIGKITGEDRHGLKITRFQTQKITRSYDEFNHFRNWKTRIADGNVSTSGPAIAKSARL